MKPEPTITRGRPFKSRRSYNGDLTNLARLRRACIIDARISTKRYATIAQAVRKIELSLSPFKTRKASRA